MPQLDPQMLVSGGDPKVINKSSIGDQQHPQLDKPEASEVLPALPAESFQPRQEKELEWFDRNVIYNERKDSQKGNSNPNSTTANHNHNHNPTSSSHRFSNFTSNSSIIALPNPQNSGYLNSKSRRHGRPLRPRFFPKKPSRSGKSITVTEPSSPKVSCIGRVMSNRSTSRRCASGRRTQEVNSKPENRTGFWNCLKALLQLGLEKKRLGVDTEGSQRRKDSPSSSPRWSFAEREREIPASTPLGDPPGLGGMKRFASGRKSAESWASYDLDLDDSVVESGSGFGPTDENEYPPRRGIVGPTSM